MVAPSATALEAQKLTLRQRLKALRPGFSVPDAAGRVVDNFTAALSLPAGAAIGGYWPIGAELNPLPLLRYLVASGHSVALPAVAAPDHPLVFRTADLDRPPRPGVYGIPAPGPDIPELTPSVVLVPLLGFDRSGWRLGYGGGYYDRTIRALRAAGEVLAVGLAYAGQEISAVPHGPFDERLDWIVTELEARRFS